MASIQHEITKSSDMANPVSAKLMPFVPKGSSVDLKPNSEDEISKTCKPSFKRSKSEESWKVSSGKKIKLLDLDPQSNLKKDLELEKESKQSRIKDDVIIIDKLSGNFIKNNIGKLIDVCTESDRYTELLNDNTNLVCELKTFEEKKNMFTACYGIGLFCVDWTTIFFIDSSTQFCEFLLNQYDFQVSLIYDDERIDSYNDQLYDGVLKPIVYPTNYPYDGKYTSIEIPSWKLEACSMIVSANEASPNDSRWNRRWY